MLVLVLVLVMVLVTHLLTYATEVNCECVLPCPHATLSQCPDADMRADTLCTSVASLLPCCDWRQKLDFQQCFRMDIDQEGMRLSTHLVQERCLVAALLLLEADLNDLEGRHDHERLCHASCKARRHAP